jgi:hypothetical protein
MTNTALPTHWLSADVLAIPENYRQYVARYAEAYAQEAVRAALANQLEWVCVEDRRPEPLTIVLAAFEMDCPGDWRIKCASYEPDATDSDVRNGWRIFGGGWRPTHWMPLPAPPVALSAAPSDPKA